jgi:transcriptional regulator with XRE-family HTH domain
MGGKPAVSPVPRLALREGKSKLRRWREAQGYTVRECAGLVGIDASGWSRIETAQRGLKPRARIQIARALGAAVEDLFDPIADEPLDVEK